MEYNIRKYHLGLELEDMLGYRLGLPAGIHPLFSPN